jgi:hypothetical protein
MCIENGFESYLALDWFERLKLNLKAHKKLDKLLKIKLGKTI